MKAVRANSDLLTAIIQPHHQHPDQHCHRQLSHQHHPRLHYQQQQQQQNTTRVSCYAMYVNYCKCSNACYAMPIVRSCQEG